MRVLFIASCFLTELLVLEIIHREVRDGEVEWLHLLRILYTSMLVSGSVSESARLNCEALLEQACALLPLHVCTAIVQALEQTAMEQLHSLVNGTCVKKNDMGAYMESNGVPCASSSDINLLLLLFRSTAASGAINRGGGGGRGTHLLPVLATSCLLGGAGIGLSSPCGQQMAAEEECHFYICCRATFVNVICCAVEMYAKAEAQLSRIPCLPIFGSSLPVLFNVRVTDCQRKKLENDPLLLHALKMSSGSVWGPSLTVVLLLTLAESLLKVRSILSLKAAARPPAARLLQGHGSCLLALKT